MEHQWNAHSVHQSITLRVTLVAISKNFRMLVNRPNSIRKRTRQVPTLWRVCLLKGFQKTSGNQEGNVIEDSCTINPEARQNRVRSFCISFWILWNCVSRRNFNETFFYHKNSLLRPFFAEITFCRATG